jgi:hypothetical protein
MGAPLLARCREIVDHGRFSQNAGVSPIESSRALKNTGSRAAEIFEDAPQCSRRRGRFFLLRPYVILWRAQRRGYES